MFPNMTTKHESRVILGIDPGYGRCGFGIIEEINREWIVRTHGIISTKKETSFPDRLCEIAADVRAIITANKVHALVIEELFFGKSSTTALKVAEARGVIIQVARESGAEVIEVKPNEVKLALTGYGRAEKKQMQEMVKTVFKLNAIPKPDDAADALAVAWCGAQKWRFS